MPDDRDYVREVGQRLRKLRLQRGMSLAKAEHLSNGKLSAVTIRSYEAGERRMNIQTLADLAVFYGVRVADLLPDEPVEREERLQRVIHTLCTDTTLTYHQRQTLAILTTSLAAWRDDLPGPIVRMLDDTLDALDATGK